MSVGIKTCKTCGEDKPIEKFKKDKSYSGGYRPHCIPCCNAYDLESYHQHKHKKEYSYGNNKDKHLKRLYGISYKEYQVMLEAQGGRCAICATDKPGKRAFAVDHCHDTGNVRGLLCTNCNTGIGNLQDNIGLLERAIEYLT